MKNLLVYILVYARRGSGRPLALATSVFLSLLSPLGLEADLFGPSNYLRLADSPFYDKGIPYHFNESFEDRELVPGLILHSGSVSNSPAFNDSVDEDDGVIDGFGRTGSWYVQSQILTVSFDSTVLGGVPTHVGVVFVDMGSGGGFYTDLTFEAFGVSGNSIGSIGPVFVGDGRDRGQTAEDRFFGASDPSGISYFTLRSSKQTGDWGVDHVQFAGESRFNLGDANLDGKVDELDLSIWTSSTFTNRTGWGSGDFNGDGHTDGTDFNIWNGNKVMRVATSTVPEPNVARGTILIWLLWLTRWQLRQKPCG